MFYRVGVVEWELLMKKTSNNGHCLVFNNEDLNHLFMDLMNVEPPYPLPYPQKLSDRTGFAQNLGLR
jgi:hypothetical protein